MMNERTKNIWESWDEEEKLKVEHDDGDGHYDDDDNE